MPSQFCPHGPVPPGPSAAATHSTSPQESKLNSSCMGQEYKIIIIKSHLGILWALKAGRYPDLSSGALA